MAGILVAQNQAALTANGTAAGIATVANSALFPVGATVFIRSNTVASVECIVTQLPSATTVGLRIKPTVQAGGSNQYGVRSDLSAYLVADAATLFISQQVADEWASYYLK